MTELNSFKLVTSSIPLGMEAAVFSEDIDASYKDETSNKSLYPDGAFREGTDLDIKQMRTWNAHVRVKKYDLTLLLQHYLSTESVD